MFLWPAAECCKHTMRSNCNPTHTRVSITSHADGNPPATNAAFNFAVNDHHRSDSPGEKKKKSLPSHKTYPPWLERRRGSRWGRAGKISPWYLKRSDDLRSHLFTRAVLRCSASTAVHACSLDGQEGGAVGKRGENTATPQHPGQHLTAHSAAAIVCRAAASIIIFIIMDCAVSHASKMCTSQIPPPAQQPSAASADWNALALCVRFLPLRNTAGLDK